MKLPADRRRPAKTARWLLPVFVAACLSAPHARAELAGVPATPPQLDAAAQGVLAANPALAGLERTHPWVVRQVLRALPEDGNVREPAGVPRDSGDRLGTDDQQILDRNPALKQFWRTNPDGMLTVLSLIRIAGTEADQD